MTDESSQTVEIAVNDLLALLEASYYAGDDAPPLGLSGRARPAQERACEILGAVGVDVDSALWPDLSA